MLRLCEPRPRLPVLAAALPRLPRVGLAAGRAADQGASHGPRGTAAPLRCVVERGEKEKGVWEKFQGPVCKETLDLRVYL